MAVAANTFAYAFIAAFAGYAFVVIVGFLRIGFCFAVLVAIMPFGSFSFHGFSTVTRHSMRDRRSYHRRKDESNGHEYANEIPHTNILQDSVK